MQLVTPLGSVSAPPLDDSSIPQQAKNYRRDIDGLRAIAVTSVVAYHAGVLLFRGGYVGVDIFFVISGYLIGAHVYKDIRHERFSISGFYQRRAKRILPALFAVLLFSYLLALFVLDAPEMKSFGEYAVATVTSSSNILAWLKSAYFAAGADQNPLLMTWSLGVEEQFYLIFPLLMLFFGSMGRRKLFYATIAVTVLSLGLSIFGLRKNPTATFYLLPTRAWELSVGILLAVYETDRPAKKLYAGGRFANLFGLVGLALLILPIVAYSDNTPFPGLAAAVPVLGSALILMSPSGWINRFLLSSRPFVFLGLVSYSWYLWHWPLLSFARIACDHPIPKLDACALAAISLFLAWCSYRFVEQPFRKSKIPVAPLLRRYAVLCVLMLIPGLALVALKGWPQRFPQLTAIEQRSGLHTPDACLAEYGAVSPNLSDHCVPTQDQREGVALIGDSHAGALGEAFRKMVNGENLKFYEMTKSSCPPLLGVTHLMPHHPGHDRECVIFNAKVLEFLRRDTSVKTVVLAGYWSVPLVEEAAGERYSLAGQTTPVTPAQSIANLGPGLAAMIAALRSSGKHVVVIKDDPLLAFDPVRRLRWYLIPARHWLARALAPGVGAAGSVPRGELISREDNIASAIVEQAVGDSVEIFDLKQNLCNDQFCTFYAGDLLLYEDPQHLSLAGSRQALHGMRIANGLPASKETITSTTPAS